MSWKDLFELADIEYWKSSAESWDHASLRDQMMICILVLMFSGALVAISDVITNQIKLILGVSWLVMLRSVINAWSFGKAEYEERNYKCYNCGQEVTEELTDNHNCPEN